MYLPGVWWVLVRGWRVPPPVCSAACSSAAPSSEPAACLAAAADTLPSAGAAPAPTRTAPG